jgi:hypothetical protein
MDAVVEKTLLLNLICVIHLFIPFRMIQRKSHIFFFENGAGKD